MIMCPKFADTFQATRHFQQVPTVKFHKSPLTALMLESLYYNMFLTPTDPHLFFGRMAGLDSEMEKEIDDQRRRYHAKRQPILDAMDQKRKRQQNF